MSCHCHCGFNTALAMSLPRNCSIQTLVKQLRTEENLNIRKVMDAALGPQNNAATNPNTSRNCARSERKEELRYLVGSFNNVSLKVYMTSLVDFFNGQSYNNVIDPYKTKCNSQCYTIVRSVFVLITKLLNLYQDFEFESFRGQGSEICKRTER